jgi:HSP20 family protein
MNQLTAYDPFADAGIDELFRGFFRPVRVEKSPATIKMDVTEQDNAYVVKAEIPGVGKEDIQVSIEGNQVTIGAEVKREKDVNRGFTLPVEVDEEASNAKYENGVLELKLAKKAPQSGRKLAIQ